ncbi:MAG: hypothetical protein MZV64_14945 [Ignavibacteriales bacterium]|nr:hypothetical protein [Ignavibacteriales bacterium]
MSFVRVTRSEIDLDDKLNPYSEEVYIKAKETLEQFKKEESTCSRFKTVFLSIPAFDVR